MDLEKLVYWLTKQYKGVIQGAKDMRRKDGRNRATLGIYKELVAKEDELYNIFEEVKEKIRIKEQDWGVKMGQMEELYLADQRNDRRMECGGSVDPVWYQAVMRRRREKEREEKNREKMDSQFLFKPLSEEDEMLDNDGDVKESEDEKSPSKYVVRSSDEENNVIPEGEEELEENVDKSVKKKKQFEKKVDDKEDPLPARFRHVRQSARKVRDDVYKVLASLSGEGLSLLASIRAVDVVANGCFGRNWKIPAEEDDAFDKDSMPHKKNIREMLKMLEAQSLDLLVDKMVQGKAEGRMLTHYTDSSTKKHVGTFNGQGIHIGKDNPFPLPILSIKGETSEDIAIQTDMAFSVLAVVRGVDESEIYKLVDVHMTDGTEHNKGFASLLAEMYSLEKPAGQLFCSSHTTIGLVRGFNKVVRKVEAEIKLES